MSEKTCDKEALICGFADFEKNQRTIMIAGEKMYDIKGHYKWMTMSELFEYYLKLIQ